MLMKLSKRAIKRHHYNRLKKKRKYYWGVEKELEADELGFVVNTPHPCSCGLCANPRRYYGEVSLQEKRQLLKERYGN